MGKHLQHKKGVRRSLGEAFFERLRCEVCDSPLLQPYGSGRKRETCSSACRQKLYRQRIAIKNFQKTLFALRKEKPVFCESGCRKLLARLRLAPSTTSDNVRYVHFGWRELLGCGGFLGAKRNLPGGGRWAGGRVSKGASPLGRVARRVCRKRGGVKLRGPVHLRTGRSSGTSHSGGRAVHSAGSRRAFESLPTMRL